MNQEFKNRHSDTGKWIVVFIAILILTISVVAVMIPVYGPYIASMINNKAENATENDTEEVMSMTYSSSSRLKLAGGSGSSSPFEKTLIATVLPADAPDKSVTWSAAWTSDSSRKNEDVSKYITVTPASSGSATATVKCLKAFTNDVVMVTVTTNVGGFTASCRVEYIGTPETLTIGTTGLTATTDASWGNIKIYTGSVGETYSLPITLGNSLNSVGSSFGNYTVTMEVFGSVVVNNKATRSGEVTNTEETYSYRIETAGTNNPRAETQVGNSFNMPVLVQGIENGKLIVKIGDSPKSISVTVGDRSGTSTRTYLRFVDNKEVYCKITVTDTVSGVSSSINVRPFSAITSLALNASTLQF